MRVGITLGDPRGIGPEVAAASLRNEGVRRLAEFTAIGPAGWDAPSGVRLETVGSWPFADASRGEEAPAEDAREEEGREEEAREKDAGRLSALAVERGIELATSGEIDGLVTGPISKRAIHAAGWAYPGHTELLRDRTGVPEVTMVMAAERTPLGGPIRVALLTAHIPLRAVPDALTVEAVLTRSRIAVRALREWWGFRRPKVCFAGINPHASEGGLFGDEEARVLEPAVRALRADREAEVVGIAPADTAFRRCVDGEADLIIVPYHDVGLAVLKTVARDTGVNVTAGLPFPRTAPDHGTAFDIAGRGIADPGATISAIELCVRFCRPEALVT